MSYKPFSWPRKSAVIISQSPNIFMFLKELLRSAGWTVFKATPFVREAIELIQHKHVFLVIVDDTAEAPAVAMIRELLTLGVGFGTPIFSFLLDDHGGEANILSQLGEPEVVAKPLTPSRFIPSFSHLIKRWESKPFIALRAGVYQYLHTPQIEDRINIFYKLTMVPAISHLVTPALALEYWNAGAVQEAERVLLQHLKASPRDLGCMLTLVDLYLKGAMPQLSKRLLISAQKMYEYSSGMLPDLVQAEMMLGNYEGALKFLEQMRKNRYWLDQTLPFMARLLHMQGRADEANELMRERRGIYQKIKNAWMTAG